MNPLLSSFLVVGLSLLANCVHLPSSFKTCGTTVDNECLRGAIEEAIHYLKDGEKSLGFLSIDPLFVERIFLPSGSGAVQFAQDYLNFTVSGLRNCEIKSAKLDKDKHIIDVEGYADNLQLIGSYKLNGKVLVLPITGDGPVNLTFVGVTAKCVLTAEPIMKKGKEYWKFTNFDVKFRPNRLYFAYDNLFNGDKSLGDNMNKFMNENWSEIFNELKAPFEESFGLIFNDLTNRVFSRVPIDEIFPK